MKLTEKPETGILLFDHRGSGQTKSYLDFRLDEKIQDIKDLWDHLDIKRTHLLGISM